MASGYYWNDAEPPAAPPVWSWYVVYAIAMALLYFAVLGGCVWFAIEAPPSEPTFVFVLMAALCVPLFLAFAAAPLLPKKSWAWYYHLALIALGLTSACCLPASGALLYFWLKPEAKAFFGVR